MKHSFLKTTFVILLASLLFSSCKKDGNSSGASRNVVYEITGNFSGTLTVVYTDNVSGNTVLQNVRLPFTQQITYADNVNGIGIGAQASVAGLAGQTAVMTIYAGNKVVKTSSATAGASGELVLPTIAYVF